ELLLTKGRFFGRDVVVAMARDISRRVARQQALEASEARYRATFEVAGEGLLIVDACTRIVRSANRRAGEILGRPPRELEGERADALLVPAGEELQRGRSLGELLTRAIELEAGTGRGQVSLEGWCLRGADGPLRWVDVEVGRFSEPAREDDDGDRLLVSLHDVSERKRSADALRALEERERAAERLRALGELAAGVAHNFNNSLTSILAHAQVLARRGGLPGEVRADLQVIERVAQGAAVTVRRIQSFARARDPEAREFCDFGDVVGNAVALTRPRWQPPDGGRWTLKYVHEEDRPLPILGNAAELCEVVVNLILNGLDAMVDGGAMRVETGVEDDRVWVEVSDQGVGIDISSQRRLFDPFFSTKGSRGLGLGLSVSHGIIRRHGGEISVFSAPGQGSTFTIWLPRAQGAT
ncbi:MAG: PAS domain S-box protein, partial [Myxococcales bacterium]|nr:PAS domain S-box protein [Myxococcales bacterium]